MRPATPMAEDRVNGATVASKDTSAFPVRCEHAANVVRRTFCRL
jgi:hypothetical protein